MFFFFQNFCTTDWGGLQTRRQHPPLTWRSISILVQCSLPGLSLPHGVSSSPVPQVPSFSASLPPLVVGPGFPPVSPKLVAAIVLGEFIELSALLDDQSEADAPSLTLVADQLVIRPTKRRKEIRDILTWMQAFSVFMLVLVAYSPGRATDLLKYQLLIMRTAQQFPGSAWLSYDRAFRRQAAAYKLTDWSRMDPELFHFHISGARIGLPHLATQPNPPTTPPPTPSMAFHSAESSGSTTSQIPCHSWNAGRCSSRFPSCRFRHACSFPGCSGSHRRSQAHHNYRGSQTSGTPSKRSRISSD